jgi:hypothetical protein
MKVLDAKVEWSETFDNTPRFMLLVDKIPDTENAIYKKKDSLYFSETDGFVRFFSYSSPGDGYAGCVFNITLENGEKVALKGPWSSRSGVMNMFFTQSCEVSITAEPDVWERGYTFYAAHATIPVLLEAAKIAGVNLLKVNRFFGKKTGQLSSDQSAVSMHGIKNDNDGEIYYHPSLRTDVLAKPRLRKKAKVIGKNKWGGKEFEHDANGRLVYEKEWYEEKVFDNVEVLECLHDVGNKTVEDVT